MAGVRPAIIPVTEDLTLLLRAWSAGDEEALRQLIAIVYPRLRRLAARHLRDERRDHTLEAGGLVHEAFLRLVQQRRVAWHDRGQFFALAARMMRRILVDHARRRRYAKRGGGARPVPLDGVAEPADSRTSLPELDAALDELMALDEEQARVVELRFFGGLSQEEIGAALGMSVPTVARRWRVARAWLYLRLNEGARHGP